MNHDNVTLALAEAPAFDPHTAAANSASTKSPRPVTAGAFAPSPWAGPRWPPSRPPAPSPSPPRPRHAGERERHGRPPASQPKRDAPVDHIHQPAGQVTRPQRRSRPALTPHPAEHSPAPPDHRRVGRPSTSTHSRETRPAPCRSPTMRASPLAQSRHLLWTTCERRLVSDRPPSLLPRQSKGGSERSLAPARNDYSDSSNPIASGSRLSVRRGGSGPGWCGPQRLRERRSGRGSTTTWRGSAVGQPERGRAGRPSAGAGSD